MFIMIYIDHFLAYNIMHICGSATLIRLRISLQYNIMKVIATSSIHIIIQVCCMEIRFLPGRIFSLTILVLMSSVLTNYVSVHVSVQVLVEAHAVEQ